MKFSPDGMKQMCPLVKARLLRARAYDLVSFSVRMSFQSSFQNQMQKIIDISQNEKWFSFCQKRLETIKEMYEFIGKPEKALDQNDWAFLSYVRETANQIFEKILEQYPHDKS